MCHKKFQDVQYNIPCFCLQKGTEYQKKQELMSSPGYNYSSFQTVDNWALRVVTAKSFLEKTPISHPNSSRALLLVLPVSSTGTFSCFEIIGIFLYLVIKRSIIPHPFKIFTLFQSKRRHNHGKDKYSFEILWISCLFTT